MTINLPWRSLGYLVCSLTLFGSISNAKLSEAATYYVAKTGSNNYTCSQAQSASTPKLTITAGVACLGAGSTLYVKTGTYSEVVTIRHGGTSWSAPLTVAANPGDTVTINPTTSGGNRPIGIYSVSYVIVDGFIVDGSNTDNDGVRTDGAANVILRNMEIKNTSMNGVGIAGAWKNTNVLLQNLKIHDTARSGGGHGVYVLASGNTIEHCKIYNNPKYGIQVYNTQGGVNNNIVRDNEVYNSGLSLKQVYGGIALTSGTGNKAYNNEVYNNNGGGIQVAYAGNYAEVYNNTIYNNHHSSYGQCIRIASNSGSGTIVKNNICWKNTFGITDASGVATVSNNLLTDPLFIDATNANFKLNAGSPAIDKGWIVSEILDDFAGVARPQGGAYDIGAYEYGGNQLASPSNLNLIDQ